MAQTPKPGHLSLVIPRPPKPRLDETMSFEPDGPPTERMEIPITGSKQDESLLHLLPAKRFARGELITSENDLSRLFYFIESGRAVEYALSSQGEPTADERNLNPTDIIGLTQCARTIARTNVTVRVIDFDKLEADRDIPVERFAAKLIRDAAINTGSVYRDRLIRAQEELTQLRTTLEGLEGIRTELAKTKQRNRDHRENGRMLAKEILRQRKLIGHLELTLNHRQAELESAASITEMFKDDYLMLITDLASYANIFEDMQSSDDQWVASMGFKLLSFLHTLRITSGAGL